MVHNFLLCVWQVSQRKWQCAITKGNKVYLQIHQLSNEVLLLLKLMNSWGLRFRMSSHCLWVYVHLYMYTNRQNAKALFPSQFNCCQTSGHNSTERAFLSWASMAVKSNYSCCKNTMRKRKKLRSGFSNTTSFCIPLSRRSSFANNGPSIIFNMIQILWTKIMYSPNLSQ